MTLTRRLSAAAIVAAVAVASAAPARPSLADALPTPDPAPAPSAGASAGATGAPPPPEVRVEVLPIINTGGAKPILPWGWAEIFVGVQNTGSKPAKGVIKVESNQASGNHDFLATAPYTVGPGASASVRVPA